MNIKTKEFTVKELNTYSHIFQFEVLGETASIVFTNPDTLHQFIGKFMVPSGPERDGGGW